MRIGLTRSAPKLLKFVNGQAHASSEDHEEESDAQGRNVPAGKMAMTEQLTMDPLSSNDEREESSLPPPTPPTPQPSQTSASLKSTRTKRGEGTDANKKADGAGSRGQKSLAKKAMITPRRGLFAKGQAHKNGEKKEDLNGGSTPSSSAGKRSAPEGIFGEEYGSQKTIKSNTKTYGGRKKPKFAAPSNIHAEPTKSGMENKRSSGNQTSYSKKSKLPPQDDDDSNMSMKTEEDHIAALDAMNERKQKENSSPKPERPNLIASLGAYKQPQSSPPDLENIDPTDLASAPASQSLSKESETLASLEQHVKDLPPEEDSNATCPLCEESVDPEHQENFWKWHSKTVKNQSLFCTAHRVRTAKARYKEQGFPNIDWDALPERIKRFRPQLVALLRNETGTESKYRKQNASKLLSGKAATVPARRKGQKREDIKKELENFDDMPASTGYYGPRGRRIMMETITHDLSDVIREVAANDPVVGRSGFAIYVQSVLVPELTVLLVKEDFGCGEKRAEQLVEEGTELGALLHEEIDDVIEVQSDEEEEEEEEREFGDLDDDEKYEALPPGAKKKEGKVRNREKTEKKKKKIQAKKGEKEKLKTLEPLKELADMSDLSDISEPSRSTKRPKLSELSELSDPSDLSD